METETKKQIDSATDTNVAGQEVASNLQVKSTSTVDNTKESDGEDLLWHYCSNATFLNIIKNGTLRLNDVRKSNDREELLWVLKICLDKYKSKNDGWGIAGQIFGAFIDGLLLDKEKKTSYLNDVSRLAFESISNNLKQEELCKKMVDDLIGNIWFFCMSTERNNLNMWRSYSENASGFSIGFKRQSLLELCDNLNKCSGIYTTLEEVKYGKENVSDIVKTFLEELQKLTANDIKDNKIVSQLCKKYGYQFAKYKMQCFDSEKEYRLIGYSQTLDKHDCFSIDVYERNGNITTCADIKFNPCEMIKTIYLGPKNKNTELEIKQILNFLYPGNEIKVIKSEIPYV